MPEIRYRNVCVTINGTHELPDIDTDYIAYYVFGKETAPTTGQLHLQGYIEFTKKMSMRAVKAALKCNEAHLEHRRGSQEQAITYCKKEDVSPFEYGTPKTNGKLRVKVHQDLDEELKQVNKMVDEGKSMKQIMDEQPVFAHKYARFIDRRREINRQEANMNSLNEWADKLQLNGYQEKWKGHLDRQNDRQVTWVVDPDGGKGKTVFSKYLIAKENAIRFTNGKTNDIAHAYDYQPIVIFDLARTVDGRVNYQVLEDLKNGILFSGKYNSGMKIMPTPPKVIVLSNFEPNTRALSRDRWDIISYKEGADPVFDDLEDGFFYFD